MRRRLERWLLDLPKPAAVVTAGQTLGRQVVGAARHLGLAVPEDVAVLAVGEDELLCRLSVPALSAIDPNGRQVGWRAAEALDGLLRGGGAPDPPAVRRVPPADLVARRSSDVRRIGHPAVRAAVELIRDRATLGLTAADVLARATVPRRTLEVAFRRHLGRTIYGEITRARVEHAKRLLRAGAARGRGRRPVGGARGRRGPGRRGRLHPRRRPGERLQRRRGVRRGVPPGRRREPPRLPRPPPPRAPRVTPGRAGVARAAGPRGAGQLGRRHAVRAGGVGGVGARVPGAEARQQGVPRRGVGGVGEQVRPLVRVGVEVEQQAGRVVALAGQPRGADGQGVAVRGGGPT